MESGFTVLKYHLDPALWVLPGKINALKNYAQSNWELTTLSSEVNVRVIVLLSLFDRAQDRVGGEKASRQS